MESWFIVKQQLWNMKGKKCVVFITELIKTLQKVKPNFVGNSFSSLSPSFPVFFLIIFFFHLKKLTSWLSEFHSGGTAFNGVVEELKKVTTRVAHVLPVSDDGGSTAEIVRVLGRSMFPTTKLISVLLEMYQDICLCWSCYDDQSSYLCIRWTCCGRHKIKMFEIVWWKYFRSPFCSKVAWASLAYWSFRSKAGVVAISSSCADQFWLFLVSF